MEQQANLTLSGTDPVGNIHPGPEAVDHGQLVQDAMKGPWQSVYTDGLGYSTQGCVDSAGC